MTITQIISDLLSERARLDKAISTLESLGVPAGNRGGQARKAQVSTAHLPKRQLSLSARKRIAAAMRLRWAKTKVKAASKSVVTANVAPAKKKAVRPSMSPEARKRLSKLAKARWAARKKTGATSL